MGRPASIYRGRNNQSRGFTQARPRHSYPGSSPPAETKEHARLRLFNIIDYSRFDLERPVSVYALSDSMLAADARAYIGCLQVTTLDPMVGASRRMAAMISNAMGIMQEVPKKCLIQAGLKQGETRSLEGASKTKEVLVAARLYIEELVKEEENRGKRALDYGDNETTEQGKNASTEHSVHRAHLDLGPHLETHKAAQRRLCSTIDYIRPGVQAPDEHALTDSTVMADARAFILYLRGGTPVDKRDLESRRLADRLENASDLIENVHMLHENRAEVKIVYPMMDGLDSEEAGKVMVATKPYIEDLLRQDG